VAAPVLRHRLIPNFNAEAEGITVEQIIEKVLTLVPRGKGERLRPQPDLRRKAGR